MQEAEWLAEQFEQSRGHLQGVAYRLLGSLSEAEDGVQEGWLRASGSGTDGVENLRGSRRWWRASAATCCGRASRGGNIRWRRRNRRPLRSPIPR